ncbi:hypothetical protein [Polymorphobacter megasporae]|uniref:hypothetical protein n=1 Tax=Glacieibacterium megasporae TaxID=2835787 RepID=UPI001C1E211B|nr:hypothetical protein [Polymorphobacter megasporae]UAJ11051.1 hypothetical protein KTC28_04885 [Polymorphobacter megasporae]
MTGSAERRLDDSQLVRTALRIDDPGSVAGYTRDRSDPTQAPQIVAEYDLTPPGGRRSSPEGPWFWCSHCQKENHWRGLLVGGAEGRRHSIGHECAAAHYGFSYASAAKAFADELKRKGALARLGRIIASAPSIETGIASILKSEGLKALDLKRQEIQQASPPMAALLSAAALSDAALVEDVTVPDPEAEAKFTRREGSRPERPFTKVERRSLGRLQGAWLLRTQDDCRDRLLMLRRAMTAAVELDLLDTNSASTSRIVAVVRGVEQAHVSAREALRGARSVAEFFHHENVVRMSRWSESKPWAIRRTQGGLAIGDRDGRASLVAALIPIEVSELPPIAE